MVCSHDGVGVMVRLLLLLIIASITEGEQSRKAASRERASRSVCKHQNLTSGYWVLLKCSMQLFQLSGLRLNSSQYACARSYSPTVQIVRARAGCKDIAGGREQGHVEREPDMHLQHAVNCPGLIKCE